MGEGNWNTDSKLSENWGNRSVQETFVLWTGKISFYIHFNLYIYTITILSKLLTKIFDKFYDAILVFQLIFHFEY